MRVVIDTNVVVSGVLNPYGPPGRIVTALLARIITLLHDERIVSEYREVLLRPAFGFARGDVEALLDFIEWAGEHVSAVPLSLVLPDQSDLPFVEVATSGEADALIRGNIKHFKPRSGRHTLLVVTPRRFHSKACPLSSMFRSSAPVPSPALFVAVYARCSEFHGFLSGYSITS